MIVSARLLAPHAKIKGASPRHQEIRRAVGDFRESTRLAARPGVSDPVAIYPDKANKNGNHANYNEHPVLAFETQEGKMLNKKLQRSRSPQTFSAE
jgi:hypothetical protein